MILILKKCSFSYSSHRQFFTSIFTSKFSARATESPETLWLCSADKAKQFPTIVNFFNMIGPVLSFSY